MEDKVDGFPDRHTLYPSLDSSQNERNFITKLQTQNLFAKLGELEKELKHYTKLKRRWNRVKNVLHYCKFPLCVLMLGGVGALFLTGLGAPIAIASSGLTLIEVIGSHLLEDSLVRSKVNKHAAKAAHRKEWIDKMYVFKNEALRDQTLDQKEIELWNALLTEYAQEAKRHEVAEAEQARNSQPNIAKELKRLQEQMSSLATRLNGKPE
jgi:hypothetical protein